MNIPTPPVLGETSIVSGSSQMWPRFCSNLSIVCLSYPTSAGAAFVEAATVA
jgi:hypothetical protein